MKKLFVILVFFLTSTLTFAQQSKTDQSKSTGKEIAKEITSFDINQTKWIIESLDNYRKQRSLGSQIELLGVAVGGVSFGFSDKPDNQRVILISGGVIVIVGYFISSNAEHYLNKKNLTLTGNGLALRF